jgi:hypothetical protein
VILFAPMQEESPLRRTKDPSRFSPQPVRVFFSSSAAASRSFLRIVEIPLDSKCGNKLYPATDETFQIAAHLTVIWMARAALVPGRSRRSIFTGSTFKKMGFDTHGVGADGYVCVGEGE